MSKTFVQDAQSRGHNALAWMHRTLNQWWDYVQAGQTVDLQMIADRYQHTIDRLQHERELIIKEMQKQKAVA